MSGSIWSASSSARGRGGGDDGLEALAGERLGERAGDARLVLDEQHLGFGGDGHRRRI